VPRDAEDAILSLDHLSDLMYVLANDRKLPRKLGFQKAERSNTWGDLIRWGFVQKNTVAGAVDALTPRGEKLLRSIASILARARNRTASCPKCSRKKTYAGDSELPWCECSKKVPFKMMDDELSTAIDKQLGRTR
jgi:hypothetical protein